MTFVFPVPAEVKAPDAGSLRLLAYDADGAGVRSAAAFADGVAQELLLGFDLEESRALSRLVIRWHRAAPR